MQNFNTKKIVLLAVLALVVSGLVWAGIFWWNNLRGAGPAVRGPGEDIAEIIKNNNENTPGENATGFPLQLPDNFKIEIFADDVPGARVLVQDGLGNFWLSQTRQGVISLLEIEDGKVVSSNAVFRNLDRPHGLAIDPQNGTTLYYAETGGVYRVQLYSEGPAEKLADLPTGGSHFTRTLGFGPDGRLYVSIGSTCNACNEQDERRAAIYVMDKDGSNFEKYADGLRNSVFFDWSYVDGRMWATEMGRDRLGDDIPPDEINIIEEGEWYGWPWFYGKNIEDQVFINSIGVQPGYAEEPIPSYIDLQAHSAPLGLAFVPEEGWPEDMWYDLLVAYHGSWNRTVPTGYKIMRLKLDAEGNFEGREDFISGWLQGGSALGRPVDVMVQPGGIMYVTDDHAGVVYKISYLGNL